MYRAINYIGAGPWSTVSYITAATTPDAPPAPSVYYVDNTEIILTLTPSSNDGGLPITYYHLYVALGISASTYDEVTYDYSSTSKTILVGDVFGSTTITAGKIYTFVYVAENTLGVSDDSDLL
jgi:hypothetical protein